MDRTEGQLYEVPDYGEANTPLAIAFARHLFQTQPNGMGVEQYIQSLRSYIMTDADGHLTFNGAGYWKGRFLGVQARHEALLERFGVTDQSSPWDDKELQRSAKRRSIARRIDAHSLPSPPSTEEALDVQDVRITAALPDTTTAGELRRSIVLLRTSLGAIHGRQSDTVGDKAQAVLDACKHLQDGFEALTQTVETGDKRQLVQFTRLMSLLAQQISSAANSILAAPSLRRQRNGQIDLIPTSLCRVVQAGLYAFQRCAEVNSGRSAARLASEALQDIAAILRSLVVPVYPRDLLSDTSNTPPATKPTDNLCALRELVLCTLLHRVTTIAKRQIDEHGVTPSSEQTRALSMQSQYIFPLARYAAERMPQQLCSTGESGRALERARASFQSLFWKDILGDRVEQADENDILTFPTLNEVAEAVEEDVARGREEPSWLLAQMDDLLGIEAGFDYYGRQSKDDWLTLEDVEEEIEE